MTRLEVGAVVTFWLGATLVLSEIRWFRRPSLAARLRPYVDGGAAVPGDRDLRVVAPQELAARLARGIGGRLARLVGVHEDLALRLVRIHADFDATAFRLRQLGWATAALAAAAVASQALPLPPTLIAIALVAAPLLAFLVLEQQLATESTRWQRHLFLELPVVSEQLGMLLSSGYSLGSAIGRISERGRGACARDLKRVRGRIQHGLSEVDALREWAAVAQVEALDRLVAVLALNREAGDLGHLIAEESTAIRQEVHRQTLEVIERRSQQVWIPVTVATLLPGVLFLAVPFIEAMRVFSSA